MRCKNGEFWKTTIFQYQGLFIYRIMGYTDKGEERQLEKMRKRQERYWVHEFMPSRCPDCRATFATEANLKRHRKNNKLCKEYRENKRAILEATAKIIDPARDAKAWVDEVIRSESK